MLGRILGLILSLSVLVSGLIVLIWSAQWILSGSITGIYSIVIMNSLGGAGTITSVIGIIMVYAWAENYERI